MVRGLNFREFGEPVPLGYFVHAWLGPQDPGHEYHYVANTTTRTVTRSFTYRFMGDQETSAWWLEWYGGQVEVLAVVERPRVRNVIDWLLGRLTGGALRLPA